MSDEERIAAVYRRLPPVSPDPATDARILAAARRTAVRRHSPFIPLAAAATLVLGVGVAWQVVQYRQSAGVDPVSQPSREVLQLDASSAVQGRAAPEPAPVSPASLPRQEARPGPMSQPRSQSLHAPSLSADVADAPPSMQRKSASGRPPPEAAAQAASRLTGRCEDWVPGDNLSREQWMRLIEDAAASGNGDRQRCVEQAFGDLFRPESDR